MLPMSSLQIVGSKSAIFVIHHSMANVKVYKCLIDFALALTISEIKYLLTFLPSKVGQGHQVQYLQLHHSMANIKIYKCFSHVFAQVRQGH